MRCIDELERVANAHIPSVVESKTTEAQKTPDPCRPSLEPRRALYVLFGTWWRILFSIWSLCFIVRALAEAASQREDFFQNILCWMLTASAPWLVRYAVPKSWLFTRKAMAKLADSRAGCIVMLFLGLLVIAGVGQLLDWIFPTLHLMK